MRTSLAFLPLLLTFAKPSTAALVPLNTDASFEEQMIPFFGQGFPTTPMAPGLNELKVVPAFFDSRKSETPGAFKISAAGLAVSYHHAFTAHWGASALTAFHEGKGNNTNVFEHCSGACGAASFSSTPALKEVSTVVMATLVFDPFSDPKGFRLPLFLGLARYYEKGTTKVEGTSGGTSFRGTVVRNVSVILPMAGLAAQFNTGKFRWTFFGILSTPFSGTVTSTMRDTGTNAQRTDSWGDSSDTTVGGVGIELQYRPWNISTVFAPTFNSSTNFYSLKWTRKWD